MKYIMYIPEGVYLKLDPYVWGVYPENVLLHTIIRDLNESCYASMLYRIPNNKPFLLSEFEITER